MVSPRVDIAFKKIFGVEENKDLLISLINSIVCEEDQIADVTLLNPYNPRTYPLDKLSILDIKAQGKDGKRFNIEIQITDEANYDKRALYYWAKLYAEQLQEGQAYGVLSKAIGIHILNFTSILNIEKYHNIFRITEQETGERYFTDFELHTIELKKFKGESTQEISELLTKIKTSLDVWVAFLTRHNLLNNVSLPGALNSGALQKALHVLDVMNFTKEERDFYEAQLKFLRMEASLAEKVRDDAMTIGMAIGEARGIEIGEARGIEIGEARGIEIGEARFAQKAAMRLLDDGVDVETIAKATGLSVGSVIELKKMRNEALEPV